MNILSMKKFSLIILILMLSIGSGSAQIFKKNSSKRAEKGLFGKSLGHKKEVKVKEPRAVLRAKKKQEANDKKLDKDYEKKIRQSQKRTIDIQTPEVQARMKQNKADTEARDKAKKKNVKTTSKKAGKKYN
jgi:hypothetical protein